MISRRRALAGLGTAALGSTAGCLDAVPFLGSKPLRFEASVSSIPQSVLEETNYQEQTRRDMTVERTFEAAGQSQKVIVTNRLVEYDRAVDFGLLDLPTTGQFRAALVTALTTPQVDVLGKTFNPVAEMNSADLAGMVQDSYQGMEDIQQVGQTTVPVAGGSTTVGEFEARADFTGAGVTVELTLLIAEAVEAGDDLVVAVGAYPTAMADRQREDVFTMFEGIEHQG